uniref:NADH:ubiquinone oxidoreductase complex assembly factor 8 n=1 Tax=Salmo trutta TaxID=8032 RepID=A0A674EY36_SALTR
MSMAIAWLCSRFYTPFSNGKCVTAPTTGRQELRKDLCVREFEALKACHAVAEKTVYNLGDRSL